MNAQPPRPEVSTSRSRTLFWVALLTPAAVALLTMALGGSSKDSRDAVTVVFMVNYLISAVAAVYCGGWLARRFCKPGGGRVLAGAGLAMVIGLVNFIVTFAGCATVAPMDFR